MNLDVLRSWDKEQQRRMALAILLLVIVIILSATLAPIWAVNASYQATIDQMRDRLQQMHESVNAGVKLRPRYAQLKRIQMSSRHHLDSNTEAVAAAELQRIIKNIAIENGW